MALADYLARRRAALQPLQPRDAGPGLQDKPSTGAACTPATPETPDSDKTQTMRERAAADTGAQPQGEESGPDPSELAADRPLPAARACWDCVHRSAWGTCREPVRAALTGHFGIVWPPPGYGATCPAFQARPQPVAEAVPALPMDDAARHLHGRRVAMLQRRGLSAAEAGRVAQRLHRRDLDGCDLRLCLECAHLQGGPAGWRCGAARRSGVAWELGELATIMQRCPVFRPVPAGTVG